MASQSEVGHQKNLANLKLLKELIIQAGGVYLPTNPQLSVAAITTLILNCETDYNNWIAKLTTYKNESNKREIAFEPVDTLVTKINQSVKQLSEPQQTLDDIQSIVSKIHGDSKKIKDSKANKMIDPNNNPTPIDPNAPPIDPISTAQQSYDSFIANLYKLIQRLQTITSYAPNEAELQIANLNILYTNLNTLNANAGSAEFALALARNQRNLSFYAPQTGMYFIVLKVKSYLRSNSATNGAIYKEASKLNFVRYVQKKKKKKKA